MPDARPTVFANPRDDAAFQRMVESLVPFTQDPSELQRMLRSTYPSAVVRARDLSSEWETVWYAYRDGHWTPADGGREGRNE